MNYTYFFDGSYFSIKSNMLFFVPKVIDFPDKNNYNCSIIFNERQKWYRIGVNHGKEKYNLWIRKDQPKDA